MTGTYSPGLPKTNIRKGDCWPRMKAHRATRLIHLSLLRLAEGGRLNLLHKYGVAGLRPASELAFLAGIAMAGAKALIIFAFCGTTKVVP